MDEKETTQEEEPEDAVEDNDERSEHETTSFIEKAIAERKAMEEAVKEMRIENDRKEKLQANLILGGESEAGKPSEKKEETPKEYRDRLLKEGL